MTKPLHTRPFNLDHAKAGAPFCCANGWAVQILKWDCRGAFPLTGIIRHLCSDCPSLWSVAGVGSAGGDDGLVMTPLGMIDGKPVFVGDEIEVDVLSKGWERFSVQPGEHGFGGCRWPAPAPVYPETRAQLEAEIAALKAIISDIKDMTDADNPESYRCDDREGCLDTVFAVASRALGVAS